MDELTQGPLLVRRDGPVAVLTLNRPQARNALDEEMLGLLRAAAVAAADEPVVRAVVITGAGDRAFSAGADIRRMQAMTPEDGRRWALLGHEVFQTIEDLPKPVIAAINGIAVGGGCELALVCDFRVMAEGAQVGQPEIKLGLIPGWGGTQRLPRLIGMALARDLVLTGRLMEADEALRAGFASRVVSGESVLATAMELAAQFDRLPPLAVAAAKRALNVGRDLDLREANALEVNVFAQCFDTADRVEGLAAFVAKRAAQFKGR